MDVFHQAAPGFRSTVADARATAWNDAEYQHGTKPMFLVTLRVKVKSKLAVPSAGLSIPSIFRSTSGPTSVLVVVDDHGQPKLTCGRWTLAENRCSPADSAASTAHATMRRKKTPTITISTVHRTQRGTRRNHRRRGRGGRGPAGGPTTTSVGWNGPVDTCPPARCSMTWPCASWPSAIRTVTCPAGGAGWPSG